ncbi:MAG: shikimate kinase [Bacillota bacterium]|jgi:shikimate kinase
MKNVYLIGMMGAGKSCIGRIAAKKTHRRFVDTDAFIEKEAGMTVAEIFEQEGEAGFRRRETAALKKIGRNRGQIVACGGGVVERKENIGLLRKSGTVVWLKRDLEETLSHRRVRQRPLLKDDVNVIYTLMERRAPLYRKACHFTVVNKGDRMRTVRELLRRLG